MKPRYEEVSTEVVAMLEKAQYLLAKAEKLDMVEHEGKKIPAFAADGKGAKDEKKKADKCPSCGGKMDMEKGMCMKMGCMAKYGTMEKASMAEKDKYCMKNFGKKYSDCSAKQKAQCDKAHGKVEKADMAEKDKYCMKRFGKKYSDCSEKQKAECDRNVNKVEKASMAEKDKYCMKNFGKKYSECTAAQKAQCDKAHGKVEKGEHHKLQTFDSRPGGVQFMSESGGQTYNAYYTTNQSLFESDDVANKGATSISFDLEALRAKMNTHENPVEGHLTEG